MCHSAPDAGRAPGVSGASGGNRYIPPMRRRLLLTALFAALALAPLSAQAQGERGRRDDHNQAREAMERRDALPLAQILEAALRSVPGEVLEVELEREDGRLLYEIEILARNGRVRSVTLDARTARVIEVEDDD